MRNKPITIDGAFQIEWYRPSIWNRMSVSALQKFVDNLIWNIEEEPKRVKKLTKMQVEKVKQTINDLTNHIESRWEETDYGKTENT